MRRSARIATLLALACGAGVPLRISDAQEPAPNGKVDEQKLKDEEFWFARSKRQPAAAAQLVLARDPLTVAVLRYKSLEELIWAELEFAVESAPPLNPDWLEEIVDGRPLPDLRGKSKDELPRTALPTYNTYCQALIYSFMLPEDVFKKSAKENAGIKFPHLWNESKINRGKVIPVQGKLVRIRKYDAPWPAKKEGVQHVYEGWLFAETKNSFPYCVVFTVLPEGVEVAEKMRRQASFEGYFLGRFKFRVGPVDDSRDIDIPLFIGPTIRVSPQPPPIDDTPFSLVVLVSVVGMLVGLAAVIILISLWFRKGDSAIQAALAVKKDLATRELMDDPEHWTNTSAGTNPEPSSGIKPQAPDPPNRMN